VSQAHDSAVGVVGGTGKSGGNVGGKGSRALRGRYASCEKKIHFIIEFPMVLWQAGYQRRA